MSPDSIDLSDHAAIRSQQRGIPMAAIETLLEYGKPIPAKGGLSYAMDKRSRRKALAELGEAEYRVIEKWLNCYAIVSLDGTLLTVAHRTRRFRCD